MSGSTSEQPTRDWFTDGRDAARRLKEELGLDTSDGDLDMEDMKGLGDEDAREAAMESGRAAARALLEQMKVSADETEDALTAKDEDNADLNNEEEKDPPGHFDLPSQKSHCMTICMVPPPSAKEAWVQLSAARRACKDPGFYRWPPHANLLYPFVEPLFDIDKELDKAERNEKKEDIRYRFIDRVASCLSRAAEQCEPFVVTLDSFGTFGGKTRGVMWADPKSSDETTKVVNDDTPAPLIRLQNELEKQFPMCKDQKKQGSFTPHMTISHYANVTDALAAKEEVQSTWQPISFRVSEIYLLQRKGDSGQFMIAATIPLGPGSVVKVHNPPIRFPDMPLEEEDWVLEERMAMKDRRKKNFKRNRRKQVD